LDELSSLVSWARSAPKSASREFKRQIEKATVSADIANLRLALAWAAFTMGDFVSAQDLHDAVLDSDRPDRSVKTEAFRLANAILIEQGHREIARKRIEERIAAGEDQDRSMLWSSLGMLHSLSGDNDLAIRSFDAGLDDARRHGNQGLQLRLTNNRAVARLGGGDFEGAVADLEHVQKSAQSRGLTQLYASATHNLGVVEARMGRLPEALELFKVAATQMTDVDNQVSLAHALLDQSRLLFDVGLLAEAGDAVHQSLAIFGRLASTPKVVEAGIQRSRVYAGSGDWARAAAAAQEAVERGEQEGLDNRDVDIARHLVDSCNVVLLSEVASASRVQSLVATGYEHPDLAVDIGLLLAERERVSEALLCLRSVASPDSESPAMEILNHAVAHAKVLALQGEADQARRQISHSLTIASDFSMSLKVGELRTMAARRVQQVAEVGVDIGVRADDLAYVVKVLRRARNIMFAAEPDVSLKERSLLTQLRSLNVAATNTEQAPHTRSRLVQRQRSLERELRDSRRAHGIEAGAIAGDSGLGPADVGVPSVHLFVHDGVLCAVIRDRHDYAVCRTGGIDEVRRLIRGLNLTLVAQTSGSRLNVDKLVARIRVLLGPILDRLKQYEMAVVVPEPALGYVPWALLTQCAIALAPSLTHLSSERLHQPTGRRAAVIAVGPGLPGAEEEASVFGDLYGSRAIAVQDDAATVDSVLRHWRSADTFHFACHGSFRTDNPLYSHLTLADGPVTFFDLLQHVCPRRVVFSACDVGRSAATSPLGLAALLLSRGGEAIVASAGPTNDWLAVEVMREMHSGLMSGLSMASALREAQGLLIDTEPSASLFSAFGLG